MSISCYNLTPAQLAEKLAQGYTLQAGPFAVEADCTDACVENPPCCDLTDANSPLTATLINLSGCPCLDGVSITLEWGGSNWAMTSASGNSCADFLTASSLVCTDGVFTFSITCGADDNGSGTPTTLVCTPALEITFDLTVTTITGPACCVGTIRVVVTE